MLSSQSLSRMELHRAVEYISALIVNILNQQPQVDNAPIGSNRLT